MKKLAKLVLLAIIVSALLSSMCACGNDNWDGTIKFPKSNESSDKNNNISDIINSIEENTKLKDIIDSIGENTEITDIIDSIEDLKNLFLNEYDTPKYNYHASYDNSIIDKDNLSNLELSRFEATMDDNIILFNDDYGNLYAYIIPWDTYYKLPDSFNNFFSAPFDCIVTDNTVEFAVKKYNQVITYRLIKGSSVIETYSYTFNLLRDDTVQSFFNYYNEDCIYFFCIPQYYIPESDKSGLDWPVIRYETYDGSKTWKGNLTQVNSACIHESPYITKFISKDVGIVCYNYHINEDLCDRTYMTTDGGKTWKNLPEITYPSDIGNYNNIVINNFTYDYGEYILSIECSIYDPQDSNIYIGRTLEYTLKDDNQWILTNDKFYYGK